MNEDEFDTLQKTNISYPGKSELIFRSAFVGEMVVPWKVYPEIKEFNVAYSPMTSRMLLYPSIDGRNPPSFE